MKHDAYNTSLKNDYSQFTISIILLLTEGGIPLEAIHKYGPICMRFTLVIFSTEPSALITAK